MKQMRGSILIIDDNPANLSVLTTYLESSGYEVLIARTGESGLEKADYAQPDLILLDFILPGINGFEVCQQLKLDPRTQTIPIIFMTSLTDVEHRLEGLRLGAVDYLTKPVQEEELLLRVSTHVRLSRLTQQLEAEVAERTQALEAEIRERRQAQEKLAYHAMLLTEISDAVISTDKDLHIQSWNQAAEALYGWAESEVLGQFLPDLLGSIYPKSNRSRFAQALAETKEYNGEIIHHHKNGAELPVWVHITALLNAGSEIYGYVTINHDIRPQKDAEEQRVQLARWQERSEVLNNLLGTISHDLRTPLSIIETNLYFLDRLSESDKAHQKVQSIRKQTGHLKKLIDDMLTLSRLDHQPRMETGIVEINQVLTDIANVLDDSIQQHQQSLVLDLGEIPPIQGNESELYRAVMNLVENAMSYTPAGGQIQLKSGQNDHELWFEVADTGIGIGEDALPHIFERYYRADKARDTNTGGAGLGLAIVKRIVEMHNGHIEVFSQVNQGTRFHLSLPLKCPQMP